MPGQETLLLLGVAERVDDGTDHRDAERDQPRRAGLAGLLVEDDALGRAPAMPTGLLGPAPDMPALGGERLEPQIVIGFVEVRAEVDLAAELRRQFLLAEPAHLLAKARIGGVVVSGANEHGEASGESEISTVWGHGARAVKRRLRSSPAGGAAMPGDEAGRIESRKRPARSRTHARRKTLEARSTVRPIPIWQT